MRKRYEKKNWLNQNSKFLETKFGFYEFRWNPYWISEGPQEPKNSLLHNKKKTFARTINSASFNPNASNRVIVTSIVNDSLSSLFPATFSHLTHKPLYQLLNWLSRASWHHALATSPSSRASQLTARKMRRDFNAENTVARRKCSLLLHLRENSCRHDFLNPEVRRNSG